MAKFDKKKIDLDEFRFGGDDSVIDSNPVLKDYLRVLYDQIKFENNMVGDFSVYGTYSVKPEMQKFLIEEIKFFQERKGDVVYVKRVLENFVLNFKITFNIIGSSQQAFLDLEEREVRIDKENITHTTRLAEIVKVGHPDFVNYVYKKWNVWLSYADLTFEDSPLLRNLLERIAMFKLLLPSLAISSLTYVSAILPILPKCGPTGILIASQFNLALKSILKTNPNFANDGIGMKRLLDNLMLKHNFFPVLGQMKEALPIFKEFVLPIKNFDFSKTTLGKTKPSLDKGREL